MKTLRFTGFPAGSASLTARQAGQTDAATATQPAPAAAVTPPAHYLRAAGRRSNGISATVTSKGNGGTWGSGFYPATMRDQIRVLGVSGNRIEANLADATFTPALWTGGLAVVYRAISGEFTEVRRSAIVGGNFGTWHRLDSPNVAHPQSSGYEFRFDSYNQPAVPYWFGVAAVDAGGFYGPIGYASYTPASVTGSTDAPTNAPITLTAAPEPGSTLPAPANVAAVADASGPRLCRITWDAVPGAIGYIVFIAYTDPATHPATPYIELDDDGGAPVQPEDFLFVEHRMSEPTRDMLSKRVWAEGGTLGALDPGPIEGVVNSNPAFAYRYLDWSGGDPRPDPALGQSYIRIDMGGGADWETLLARYWHGGSGQTYYSVLDPSESYRMEVWVRASRATTIQWRSGISGTVEEEIPVGTVWSQITRTASPDTVESGTGVKRWSIKGRTLGEGALTLDFAAFRLYETGRPYLALREDLVALGGEGIYLRDHTLIKDEGPTTDAHALTNPSGESPAATTLQTFLTTCLELGARPWIQIEWYHKADDWQAVIDYLCAPVSSGSPWALKRAAAGRIEPWVDVFDEILFEIGNEPWNLTLGFQRTPANLVDSVTSEGYGSGEIYGLIARQAALAMQASPNFSPKIKWVLGGWVNSEWSPATARTFRLPCRVGIALYNGGWESGADVVGETDASYQAVMAVVPGATGRAVDDLVDRLQSLAEEPGSPYTYGVDLHPTVYEGGPGYSLNGLNGAVITPEEDIVQEVVMKSRATGTGTFHSALRAIAAGYDTFNHFTFGRGDRWSAGARDRDGSGVTVGWQMLRALASAGPCEVMDATRIDDAGFAMLDFYEDLVVADRIFAFALKPIAAPDTRLIAVGNIDRTTTHKPTLRTPWSTAATATVWANLGDYREHNRYPPGTRVNTSGGYDPDPLCVAIDIQPQTVAPPADLGHLVIDDALGATPAGLPPGNCLLIRFTGVS